MREQMLYMYEVGLNICFTKDESAVDPNKVTMLLKKSRLICLDLDDQASLDKPRTVESEAVLQIIA